MQYLIDLKSGSVFWCDEGTLMFAPLSIDKTFDTDEGGQVDFERIDVEDRANMEAIKKRLC
jgi:hypothetical protein